MSNKSHTNFHIFIFLSKDVNQTYNLVNEYFGHMRSGDILGILYLSKKRMSEYKVGWNEKTQLGVDGMTLFHKKIKQGLITNFDEAFSTVIEET